MWKNRIRYVNEKKFLDDAIHSVSNRPCSMNDPDDEFRFLKVSDLERMKVT